MRAYVLIQLNKSREREIVEKLKSMKHVKSAHILFGEWDIIVEVEVENAEDLGTFVMDNIRSIDEVDLTSSLIVAG